MSEDFKAYLKWFMPILLDVILIIALVSVGVVGSINYGKVSRQVNAQTLQIRALQAQVAALQPKMTLASTTTSQWTAQMAALVHADDGASVKLPGGRTVWIFGDTTWSDGTPICEPGACPYGLPHDSMVVESTSGSLSTLHCSTCPYKLQKIPNQGSTVLWANGGVVDGTILYVFADRITFTGTGPFDFTVDGPSVAEFNASTLAYVKTVNLPGMDTDNMAVRYGTGWAVFATSGDPKQMDVAYVPLGKLATATAWQWHMNVIPWNPAGTVNWSVGTAVSVVHSGTQWILFTKDGDFLGTQIDRASATSPYGPWALTSQWLITPPAGVGGGEYTYSVQVHPEQAAPAGDVLVSYAVNGGPDSDYHLQFMDLPLVTLSSYTSQLAAWQAQFTGRKGS